MSKSLSCAYTVSCILSICALLACLLLLPGPDVLKGRSQPHTFLPQPTWGCEQQELPAGKFHILISSVLPSGPWMHWLPHVGMTGSHAFIYYRVQANLPHKKASFPKIKLPCQMSLFYKQLLPNKGRESAVFFYHILDFYDRLPLAIALLHDHGPLSIHSLCGPAYRRLRGYYRDLNQPDHAEPVKATSQVVTLNSGCNAVTAIWHLGWTPPDNCCMALYCSNTPQCPFQHLDSCLPRILSGYDPRQQNEAIVDGRPTGHVLLRYSDVGLEKQLQEIPSDLDLSIPVEEGYSSFLTLLAEDDRNQSWSDQEKRLDFWSCCAQFVVPRGKLLMRGKRFYQQALQIVLDNRHGRDIAKTVEWNIFEHLYPRNVSDVLPYAWYDAVDYAFINISGCPIEAHFSTF
ncbi:hypothetical protein CEUSTIGMA_g153.t1 [Chlamydomonas eustigma]|uniref:Uncharacterized protein n=1 Tax=Chlamydomonas eustigma TaxID=1157962 RepID=A0A250WPD1_9CHLO|nr:hypothetical protein CEUSTIGMA_g153.t1 [Chlamydomonas eustigma]|eukprot:GAX72697.1 hypothetical protein CEUSTIGMA_g153.t1 [Chlamydomonas eustigma]